MKYRKIFILSTLFRNIFKKCFKKLFKYSKCFRQNITLQQQYGLEDNTTPYAIQLV
jgi:hypothetical protein